MSQNKKHFIVFLCLLSFSIKAWALYISDLNIVSLPVHDRSNQVLKRVLSQAFMQVLVKMSGNTAIMTLPDIQHAADNMDSYVISYGYVTETNDNEDTQLVLKVTFDTRSIKQLLSDSHQTFWGAHRPMTLVWLWGIDKLNLINDAANDVTDNFIVHKVKEIADQRGLPVIFAVMDLKDQALLSVWQQQDRITNDQLKALSQRYHVTSIITGNVKSDDPLQWEWHWLFKDTPYQWQSSGNEMASVIKVAMNRVADMMANQLTTLDTKNLQQAIHLRIIGVTNLNDYVHIVGTIQHMANVSDVTINDMHNDMVDLTILHTGGIAQFANDLNVSAHFIETLPPPRLLHADIDLYYRWDQQQTRNDEGAL